MDDLDFFPSIASDEEIIDVDYGDVNLRSDASQFDGERCGICMDVIIDRGVLDCCQHWFCFTCVDNWSTITNLCPHCQNEFQMITCVPVYDTIGSNKFEEESSSREDDWCIEGNNNSLSFPYYIDEDAVICLDGSGCKIRGGVARSEGYGSEDTSIACDSCDIWYHAFCVGFDPEGESETWLCPRCMANEMPQALSSSSIQASSYHQENASNECVFQNVFSGKVSVSVADSGETALVVSILPRNQVDHLPNADVKMALTEETTMSCSNAENIEDEHLYLPTASGISSEMSAKTDTSVENLPSMSRSKELFDDFCTHIDPGTNWSQHGHGADISPKFSVCASPVHGPGTCKSERDVEMVENIASDGVSLHMPSTAGDLSELLLGAGDVMDDHEKDATKITLIKGQHLNSCGTADPVISDAGETKVSNETEVSVEKIKVEANDGPSSWQEGDNALHSDSQNGTIIRLEDDKGELNLGKTTDIMSIVRGTRKRPSKGHEGNAARVGVKKIMRTIKDKDSSMVQNLREEIREAVQNKSSNIEENLSDPKLLAAFQAVIAGSEAERVPKISRLAVKAKKSLLQKGKVRQSLTRKIYATNNGKRKRAWDRECDVEFWKYRCMRTTKPEKMETLRLVLDILRGNPMNSRSAHESDQPATSSILSRLYLADTSVMPRKDDVKPITALEAVTGNDSQLSEEPASRSRVTTTNASKSGSSAGQGSTSKITNSKHDVAGGSQVSGSKGTAMKASVATSDDLKSDKRKWALEILARKSASNCKGASTNGHQDNDLFKGTYPLLAQLPVDIRPELAAARHNKIPVSVRLTQLYRLTEHFLRKTDLPVIFRNAETELAVVDAVNVEKDVADRSSSKLVYVNLCSQMLLLRQEDKKSSDAIPSHPLSSALVSLDKGEQEVDECPDSEISGALRAAGLLSDSPPNSPLAETQPHNREPDISMAEKDTASDNFIETSGSSDLDVRPDIKGDLGGEERLRGTGTAESSKQPLDNGTSTNAATNAATSSTNYPENPASVADDARETEQATAVDEFLPFKNETDAQTGTSSEEHAAVIPCDSGHPLANDKPDDPSMIAHDGSCAPEKESPGNKECNEASNTTHDRDTEVAGKSCSAKPSPDKDAGKFSVDVDSIWKKVEAYVKEHIRPLCKSGVITAEQYKWSVARTAQKVMRYHSKAKNASFLIKEGEKVKRLAEQYVEAAQTREQKSCKLPATSKDIQIG